MHLAGGRPPPQKNPNSNHTYVRNHVWHQALAAAQTHGPLRWSPDISD